MLRKTLKSAIFATALCAARLAFASPFDPPEPNKVLMYYFPSAALKNPTTLERTQAYKTPAVVVKDGADNEKADDAIQYEHGIQTQSGLSVVGTKKALQDHTKLDLTTPAKVVIFTDRKRKSPANKPASPEFSLREPFDVQIIPIHFAKEILKEKATPENAGMQTKTAEKPTAAKPKKKKIVKKIIRRIYVQKTPEQTVFDASRAFDELQNCGGKVDEALTALAKALDFDELPANKTSCDVFNAVATYLKKCHPYPVVYYTPTNAAVARDISLQKSVDLLTGHYSREACGYLNLAKINFEKAEFYKSALAGVDFSESYFNFATFMDGDFSDTVFKGAIIDNALIQNVNLSGAYFKNAVLKNTHVQKSDLRMANFEKADLVNTQFRDVNLDASSFGGANMANTLIKKSSAMKIAAQNADFTRAVLSDVALNGADARNADFSNIVCDKCVFDGADLQNAWLYQDLIVDSSFAGANLQNANLTQSRFEKSLNLKDADLYRANVSDVNLRLFSQMSPEDLRLLTVNRATEFPAETPRFDEASYDTAIFEARRKRPDFNSGDCSAKVCADRLLGRASNHNLAVRATTVLSDAGQDAESTDWAICTMSCIARADKMLEPSQIDILTSFVRRERPWSHEMFVERPAEQKWGELPHDTPENVQKVLHILTALSRSDGFAYNIDLTRTDLRGTDLSDGDLNHFDFRGSNVSMANFGNAVPANSALLFNDVIFDEYTVFPQAMNVWYPHLQETERTQK